MARLPPIPHCEIEPECCGTLCQVVDSEGIHFECNECSAVVSKEDAAHVAFQLDSSEVRCPRCGQVNRRVSRRLLLSYAGIAEAALRVASPSGVRSGLRYSVNAAKADSPATPKGQAMMPTDRLRHKKGRPVRKTARGKERDDGLSMMG
jgi:hypothetical protein